MSTFAGVTDRIVSSCIDTDDTCIIGRIWCDRDSSNTAPTITVNSSGDLVATTDGTTAASDFYEVGGTAGTIDVSDANGDTWQEVVQTVNNTKNWHLHLIGVRGDESSDDVTNALSEVDCGNPDRAADLLDDTSVTKRYRIGITAKLPGVRDSDEGYINEILGFRAIATFSSTLYLYIWEINDASGEYSQLYKYTMATATELARNANQIHIQSQPGHRLLVGLDCSAAISAASLTVRHRTFRAEH